MQRQQIQKKAIAKSTPNSEIPTRPFAAPKPASPDVQPRSGYNLLNKPLFPIQAKLTIGQPNDKYEQEADPLRVSRRDRVAHQVVNQIDTPQSIEQRHAQSSTSHIQRQTVNILGVKIGKTRIYNQAGHVVGRISKNIKIELDGAIASQVVDTDKGTKALHRIRPVSASQIDLGGAANPDDLWISGTRFANANAPLDGGHELDAQQEIKEEDAIAKRLNAILTNYESALNYDIGLMKNPPTLKKYKNLLIDLSTQEISNTRGFGSGLLADYLKNTLSYTACYDAASRLLTLLGVNDVLRERQGGNMTIAGVPKLKTEVIALTDEMQNSHDTTTPTIFRIEFAKHGFVLVVRHGRVEHLQGFAHESDVLKSIDAETTYTIEGAKNNLQLMASSKAARRKKGASNMGWNAGGIEITHGNTVVDPIQFRWWSKPLATMREVTDRVTQQIQASRREVVTAIQNGDI